MVVPFANAVFQAEICALKKKNYWAEKNEKAVEQLQAKLASKDKEVKEAIALAEMLMAEVEQSKAPVATA